MKITNISWDRIASRIALLIVLGLFFPHTLFSRGYPELADVKSPSVSPPAKVNEDLKLEELAEDLKVYKLIEDLKAEDMTTRLDAVLALGKIKSQRAVMALIPLLRNSHSDVVRYVAATSLGEIGDPRAVMPLIDALKDRDTTGGVQVAAATALAKIKDPKAVEPLTDRLKDENPDIRVGAANALGIIGDPRAVMSLIAALGDENPFVRYHAAKALGEVKGSLAVSPLVTSFKEDSVSEVRWWAAHALGEIRDPRAIVPLASIVVIKDQRDMGNLIDVIDVKDPRYVDHPLSYLVTGIHWSIKVEAIHSLGKIGEEALPNLISILLGHNNLDFRKVAAEEIIEIRCVQYMIHLLKDDYLLEIVKEVYGQAISKGEAGTEQVLMDVLKVHGGINMARDFIGSENPKLAKAAEDWMKSRGYKRSEKRPESGPRWGEDREDPCQTSSKVSGEKDGLRDDE